MTALGLDDLRAAHARIRDRIHRTPVVTCASLDRIAGARLYLKCENYQKVGAFKFRGATNAVYSLTDAEASHGVVTHSSGNHGAALACAAATRGIPAIVVMPRNAPAVKQAAVRGYGAEVRLCEPTLEARERTASEAIAASGGTLIHPFDDDRVIAGQGTAALELLEEVPHLDAILTPVGGGGLLSGTLLAAKLGERSVTVVAAEPRAVDDAYRSLESGRIEPATAVPTVADGLKTSLGERTFPIIRDLVDEIALVDEDDIVTATWTIIERAKLVIEPSAAVPFAALASGTITTNLRDKHVGIILSGGNIDLRAFAREHG